MSLFVAFRLVPTRRLDAGGDLMVDRLERLARVDAGNRQLDLTAPIRLHYESGPGCGAPDGMTLVVAYAPARPRQ